MKNNKDLNQQNPLNPQNAQINLQAVMNSSYQIDKTMVRCEKNNQAYLFCFNQKCKQKSCFTCNDFKCKCNFTHMRCQTAKNDMALQSIASKFQNTQKLKQYVDEIIDQEIDRLSILREKLLVMIDEKGKFLNLNKIQIQFYNLFQPSKNSQPQTFTGESLSLLWEIISNKKTQINVFDQMIKSLKEFVGQSTKAAHSLKQKFDDIIQKKSSENSYIKINQLSIRNSSIINTNQKLQSLLNLFDKKINNIRLLFKARDHNFKLSQYYIKCGLETSTIIICLNQHGKILGGFTPLKFDPRFANKNYLADPSNQTFVFSFNTNQKFTLKNIQRAISSQSHGNEISFAGFFQICDNADTMKNSNLNFSNQNYNIFNYKGNKSSNQKIIGSQNYCFIIKEWEVIKLQFQETHQN